VLGARVGVGSGVDVGRTTCGVALEKGLGEGVGTVASAQPNPTSIIVPAANRMSTQRIATNTSVALQGCIG
jgi:hypothetical protein